MVIRKEDPIIYFGESHIITKNILNIFGFIINVIYDDEDTTYKITVGLFK